MSLVHCVIAVNQELREDRQDSDWKLGWVSSWEELCCSLLPAFHLVTGKELSFDGAYNRVFMCGETTDLTT